LLIIILSIQGNPGKPLFCRFNWGKPGKPRLVGNPKCGLADDYFLFALIITHVLKILDLQSTRFLTGDFDRLNFFIVSEDDECE